MSGASSTGRNRKRANPKEVKSHRRGDQERRGQQAQVGIKETEEGGILGSGRRGLGRGPCPLGVSLVSWARTNPIRALSALVAQTGSPIIFSFSERD